MTILEEIAKRPCEILGFGVSNRPLLGWLKAHGATDITVRDMCDTEKFVSCGYADTVTAAGARYRLGKDYLEGMTGDSVIFRSPGIRPDHPAIARAVEQGAVLTSEMELFFEITPAQIIAVTGSDGKTTTTTVTSLLIRAMLDRLGKGKMYLGGNIGTPLLPLVDQMTPDDIAVVELSSFQLSTMTVSPKYAAITNITPNHLNWHTDMREYTEAKKRIIYASDGIRGIVLNRDNSETLKIGCELKKDIPVIWFSGSPDRRGYDVVVPDERRKAGNRDYAVFGNEDCIFLSDGRSAPVKLCPLTCLHVPGRHNIENLMTASALLALATGNPSGEGLEELIAPTMESFNGVANRLELVGVYRNIRFYNSSIDSTPSRTCAALRAITEVREKQARDKDTAGHLLVICGGRDKHVPFCDMAVALTKEADTVICAGEARNLIADAIKAVPTDSGNGCRTVVIEDWKQAIEYACSTARPGDWVLLSPGCTSFDAFANFEERGRFFAKTVSEYYK